jgi:hypothetical protein
MFTETQIAAAKAAFFAQQERPAKEAQPLVELYHRIGHNAFVQGLREYNSKIEKMQKLSADTLDPLVRGLLKNAANGTGKPDARQLLADDAERQRAYLAMSPMERIEFRRLAAERAKGKLDSHIARTLHQPYQVPL